MTQDVKQLRVKIFDELSQIVDQSVYNYRIKLIDEVDINDANVVDLHLTSPFCPTV